MDGYIGEIRLLPYTYAPEGWLWCNGQVVSVSQYQALFAVIGTRYGGDGRTNFNLPDLRGRAVVSATLSNGNPPGLTPYALADQFGAVNVTAPLAQHTHGAKSGFAGSAASTPAPTATGVVSTTAGNNDFAIAGTGSPVNLAPQSLGNSSTPTLGGPGGVAAPHTNLQPFLPIYFAICWNGTFPSPA